MCIATILEIECRDRAGLLLSVGNCLLDEQINIHSAHIEVVGNRAIDAFYLSGENGRLTKTQKKRLREALSDILRDPIRVKAA